jgi:hypothetical protein
MVDPINCISIENNISPSLPHITLEIPDHLSTDFLGTLALDILHDSKGHGYLTGNKLSQLTDLISASVIYNNQNVNIQQVKLYIFKKVLAYFVQFWSLRLDALGLHIIPDFNNSDSNYWNDLGETVVLPLRHVAEREDDDTFVGLGPNKDGIETQSYYNQKEKLTSKDVEILSFISPLGINKADDYFNQATGIVDIIQDRTKHISQIVLDMKSSAGLIRTIADPIGYITCLPTYADPGYNMPGMSAIRQYSKISFLNDENNEHSYHGAQEFNYCIKLQTPFYEFPLTILDVRYFYGVAVSGLDRSNMMISILDTVFHGSLPRSVTMAEALHQYLGKIPQELTMSVGDILENIQILIKNYYISLSEPLSFLQDLTNVYRYLHCNKTITPKILSGLLEKTQFAQNADSVARKWIKWCNENIIFRYSYLLTTLRYLYFFKIQISPTESLYPETMIQKILPELLFEYINVSQECNILAFCFHQFKLIQNFIADSALGEKLNTQWLPHHKGKLCTQLQRHVHEWKNKHDLIILSQEQYLRQYLQSLLYTCRTKLATIADINNADPNDSHMVNLLEGLPVFQPPDSLQNTLMEYIYFYQPELYVQTKGLLSTGLSLTAFLDFTLESRTFLNLQEQLYISIRPSTEEYEMEALRYVLGKFSGDLGQVLWSMCYGHIFASEDNNISAMALLLHRLPKECIQRNTINKNPVWANIHGLGDGGNVDIIINKNHL